MLAHSSGRFKTILWVVLGCWLVPVIILLSESWQLLTCEKIFFRFGLFLGCRQSEEIFLLRSGRHCKNILALSCNCLWLFCNGRLKLLLLNDGLRLLGDSNRIVVKFLLWSLLSCNFDILCLSLKKIGEFVNLRRSHLLRLLDLVTPHTSGCCHLWLHLHRAE